jgi:2-keto-4-pentenoate hydratase/2-oxohepta-3-ene-1,7-dioic acid hydratase in catechol pathway
MIAFIEEGKSSLDTAGEILDFIKGSGETTGPDGKPLLFNMPEVSFKAPIAHPPKFFCAAVTRKESWERAIKPKNPHPTYFIKLSSCIIGPYDAIEIPDIGVVGPEVEVAAVISKRGKNIPLEKVKEHIFGYTLHNDITAHELRKTSEWITMIREDGSQEKLTYSGRYKCFDTFAPMGPWIVTQDEFRDINQQALSMTSKLNGVMVQSGTTAETVFPFIEFIRYLSEAHTLEPGDIVSGGTVLPAPGWSMTTIDLRKIGGTLESEVEGIGNMRNPIVPI